MTLFDFFVSLISGFIIGFLYGLSFVKKKQRKVHLVFSTILRMSFFGGFLFYMLHSQLINCIIFLPAFLFTFWSVIFIKKVYKNGKL